MTNRHYNWWNEFVSILKHKVGRLVIIQHDTCLQCGLSHDQDNKAARLMEDKIFAGDKNANDN